VQRNTRGPAAQTDQEMAWYQQIVDQTIESSYLKGFATLEEQAAPMLTAPAARRSGAVKLLIPQHGVAAHS
jgi:dihydroxycyclohexadiene carboxylate dehydrogenase